MKYTLRKYQKEEDYWRIRKFARECFLLNKRQANCWQVATWDYWRWHINLNCFEREIDEQIWLCESEAGELAGVLHTTGLSSVFFDLHPQLFSLKLQEDFLHLAQKEFGSFQEDGSRKLFIWSFKEDAMQAELLKREGFTLTDVQMRFRSLSLEEFQQDDDVPEGIKIRALGGKEELPARSWASWTAFHPEEPDDKYQGWEWYLNIQRMPLYRRDLDLVAVTNEGIIAGFTTIWFDDYTRSIEFEPVGIDKNFQRRGIGRALLQEGMRRGSRLGATLATVTSEDDYAHKFYEKSGFKSYQACDAWLKIW